VCDILQCEIDTGDALPVRSRCFRYSPEQKKVLKQQVQELLDADIIEPSDSPWSSQVLLVKKKGSNEPRFCVDYRRVNELSRLTSYPLPTMDSILDNMAAAQPACYSTIDLKSGYWQTAMAPGSKDKTAFSVEGLGNFAFKKLTMGISGGPGFFQRVMDTVLKGLIPEIVLVYLDDILVYSRNPQEMVDRLALIFDRFRAAKLKIHPKKSHFGVAKVCFLGHEFTKDGVSPDARKFDIVRKFPVPRNQKQIKSFLGLTNFYRKFISGYSLISQPLRELLKNDRKFLWTKECEESFQELKEKLITAPVLMLPKLDQAYFVSTDASRSGIAWTIQQKDEKGRLRPVLFGGRALRDAEQRYNIHDLEGLALYCCFKDNYVLLANNDVTVMTDNSALSHLMKMKLSANSRLTRWAMFLQPFRIKIEHRSGKSNVVADCLSRIDWQAVKQEAESSSQTNAPTVATAAPCKERVYIEFDVDDGTPFVCPVLSDAEVVQQMQLPDTNDFRAALPTCVDFAPMYNYLREGTLPTDEKHARRLIYESENYVLEDGLLWFLYTPRTRKLDRAYTFVKRLCVPRKFQAQIAIGLHDKNLHLGFQRLYATARMRYYFPNMYAFLKEHVFTCQICQEAKRPVHPERVPLLPLPNPKPLTYWVADFHGPFPPSCEEGEDAGNAKKYVLCFIDSTSMFPELVAVRDTSAKTFIRAFFDNVVARYGVPKGITLQSDNGAAFIAKVSKMFAQTFGIRRNFSSPHHPCVNSRCEQFGDSLNKALRILTTEQNNWSSHLQAVAMAHRGSATINLQLSPFEVLYGRPMTMFLDAGLLAETEDSPSLTAYRKEVAPKLEILHDLAMQNAAESASRQRDKRNVGSKPPSYKVADKVLLHDTSTKSGDSAKWTKKWTGPFFVKEILPNYNYKLQCLKTGRDLKRSVHASRLRPLRTMLNDYRLPQPDTTRTLFETTTQNRQLEVRVTTGDLLTAQTQAIVHVADDELSDKSELSRRLYEAAGIGVQNACREHVVNALPKGHCFITAAGDLAAPTTRILHLVATEDNSDVRANTLVCLEAADTNDSGIVSITIPFFGESLHPNLHWDFAQQMAQAILNFDEIDDQKERSLQRIDIMAESLLAADVLTAVFRNMLVVSPMQTEAEDTTQLKSTPSSQDQWYEIDAVLKRRKTKDGDLFLVKWKGSSETSWVPRRDLTDAAIAQYISEHPRRRRKRRN
jgi:O-acetyl-ADP-ribose deacetylase (regulator of RNase III)/transposase InsO family protein